MPDDAYFEGPVRYAREAALKSRWTDSVADIRYESACLVLSRVVAKAYSDDLDSVGVINLLITLLPWPQSDPEELLYSITSQAVEQVERSYWELGHLLIDKHFQP